MMSMTLFAAGLKFAEIDAYLNIDTQHQTMKVTRTKEAPLDEKNVP